MSTAKMQAGADELRSDTRTYAGVCAATAGLREQTQSPG